MFFLSITSYKLGVLRPVNQYSYVRAMTLRKQATWCFTPSQPVPLYQGDVSYKPSNKSGCESV